MKGSNTMTRAAEIHRLMNPEDLLYPTHGASIVVASENAIRRRHIAEALRIDGYYVSESDLDETLLGYVHTQPARREPVEVVILDISEFAERGLDLLHAIRSFDWALRIIVLAHRSENEAANEATRLGVNATLSSPWDLDDLRTVVLNVAPPG